MNLDVFTVGNVWGDISVTGTVPSGVVLPASRMVSIGAGLQASAPVSLGGAVQGQIILNRNNGTQVWSAPTTINGQSLSLNSDFEFSQTSAQLGGGAIGMAPFRLWKSDCIPAYVDNTVIGAGSGVFESKLADANQKPIKIRFYGPIQRGAGYANWKSAFHIECRPLGGTGAAQCNWMDASDGFEVSGPETTTTDVTARRTISIGRRANYFPTPGIYRIVPKRTMAGVIDSVLSADVTGNPATNWPEVCGPHPDEIAQPARAYVFRIKPDCDSNGVDDETQTPRPSCFTNCHIADYNHNGEVTVQDIFDFLADYFAQDPDADINGSGSVTVQDIFDYLYWYFSAGGGNC